VKPPAPTATAKSIASALSIADAHALKCRIQLPRVSGNAVYRQARRQSVTNFGVDSSVQLTGFSDDSINSVMVARPQTLDELQYAANLHTSIPLLWVIDHYVHAEQLAAAAVSTVPDILIQLQYSDYGFGVRPGTDAVQLAQGIQRLSGVRMKGFAVHVPFNDDSDALMRAARSTYDRLQSHGIPCDIVSLSAATEAFPARLEPITEIHAALTTTDSQLVDSSQPSTATVVSRPSLEHAVVVIAGIHSEHPIRFPDHPQCQVLEWHRDCCSVRTTGSTARLNIGDQLNVTVES